MLWPVLIDREPLSRPWRVGDEVTVALDWVEAGPPEELALRDVELQVSPLPVRECGPAWQLLTSGGFRAVRRVEDGLSSGRHRLAGLPCYDRLAGRDVATTGTVRRLQVVHRLLDRLESSWRPVPGALRVVDVEEATPMLLRDDPPLMRHPPSQERPPGPLRFLTEQQYLREAGHLLPPQRWRAVGFLAHLEVTQGDGPAADAPAGEGP